MRYLALLVSETKYSPVDEPAQEILNDAVTELLNSKKLGGVIRNLNESMIFDFQTILDNLPVEKCEYIYDCINESINEDSGKHYSYKMKLKLAEIVCKHFNYKNNKDLLMKLMKTLISFKYCKLYSIPNFLLQLRIWTTSNDQT